MTNTLKSPVTRETPTLRRECGKLRPIIARLDSHSILFRLKGCRFVYSLPYDSAYGFAARLEGDRLAAERQANRQNRKRGR